MGAWKELDTTIVAEVDTSDLEALANLDDEFGIFESLEPIVEDLKTSIHQGSSNGVAFLSNFNRSIQEQYINDNCKNPSGMLASSIYDMEKTPYEHEIGTTISHIYPLTVEFGRGPVYPIRAKALAFYSDDGELIFRKSVGKAEARPFVAPAYDDTDHIAETIMVLEIAHAGIKWD